MVSGKYQWVNKHLAFYFLFFIFFAGCRDSQIKEESKNKTTNLENGDLIFRHGNGFFSNYFKNTSNVEQIYSHGGIVYIHNDSIYVIHSEASEFTGIGGVKKEPLDVFLDNINTWGVYRIDTTQDIRDSVVLNAIKYIDANTQFDFDFDNNSDEKLYCTELIATVINKTMKREVIVPNNTFRGKPYYAIDDTYLIPEVKLVTKHTN